MAIEEVRLPKQLLVEGRSAVEFFKAMLRHLGLEGDVQVQDFGGITELKGFLKAVANAPGFRTTVTSLAVVRDAEENPAGAFQSVRSALAGAGLPQPATVGGYVSAKPRTGVFILPDGASSGMLETICLRAVATDPAMKCVDDFFDCLQRRQIPGPKNKDKARVQAFLASRETSGLLLGQAAHKRYWSLDASAFETVRTFLKNL